MNKDTLKNKIAEILKVSDSEKDLAFEMMLKRLAEILNFDEAISIPDVGIFSLKKEPLLREERNSQAGVALKKNLIFLPNENEHAATSKSMYLTFNLDSSSDDYLEFDENVFSVSIEKPVVSVSGIQSGNSDSSSNPERMLATLEEKVQKLVANTEKISNYDIWNEYTYNENETEGEITNSDSVASDADLKQLISESVEGAALPVSDDVETKDENESEEIIPEHDDKIVNESIEDPVDNKIVDDSVEQENDLPNDSIEEIEEIVEPEKESGYEEQLPDTQQTDVEDSKDNAEGEEINWDWGDELKEELEADAEKLEDGAATEELDNSKENSSSELFESVENTKIDEPAEEESETQENNDDEVEQKEQKGNTQTVIYSPGDDDENRSTNTPIKESKFTNLKKKISFGKTFWVLVGAFALIGIIGIYFLFFTGTSTPKGIKANVIPDTLIHKRLKPLENILVKEKPVARNSEQTLKEDSVSSQKSNAAKNENVKPSGNKTEINTQKLTGKSQSLYRSFPNEKQIRNLIYLQNGVYSVQVSSRRNKIKAEQYVKKLRNAGFNAFIVKTYLSQLKSTWYRVRIGFFKTIKETMDFRIKNKF